MSRLEASARGPHATLIGDIVLSREAEDRVAVQRSVDRVLQSVNQALDPVQPLEPTLGDEFQGAFGSPSLAARASLLLRLQLLKDGGVDSRFGLGYGSVTVFGDRTPVSQDGPGWWSARGAIERAVKMSRSGRTEFVRTWFASAEGETGASPVEVHTLNAFLACRDAIVTAMRPRSRRLLLGLILKRSQAELAAEEGISQSAVSQDLSGSGAYAIQAAELELDGTSSWS